MGQFNGTAIAVIPARWASTRFPGKPLAEIAGEPMIAHVIRRAAAAETISEVVVATDDERIAQASVAAGAAAIMTGECPSGTDRVAEAARQRPGWDLVVNIQGDEPLLSARNIDVLVEGMALAPQVAMGTLCRPLPDDRRNDPNAVKVVRGLDGRALYFSRSAIPFRRETAERQVSALLHLGIYAFTRVGLQTFVGLEPSPLEKMESLEQLRALENGMDILVLDALDEAIGVDTPEDLQRVERLLARQLKE
ncbi:MAG: 3-deoxy-manno-octulosonate cytidylyltransferase [Acidobacteriota bacterium]